VLVGGTNGQIWFDSGGGGVSVAIRATQGL
jgi:hypothetical protein